MKYFKLSEFECKCGCGLNNFSHELAVTVDEMRGACGFPFKVRSACRCISHNKKEGGKRNSDHLATKSKPSEGVDIQAINNYQRFKIIQEAIFRGIDRIGIGRTFIHLGIREGNPKERIWLY